MLPARAPRGLVFIVDDDERFGDLVASTLVEDGWAVSVHTNAADALAAIAHTRPDVVVVDVVMPDVDGLQLATEIRANDREQPIMLFSSLFDQHVSEAASRLGLDYVEKADGPERLLRHLDALVASH
jgi:two-component system, OmpR family, response regulator